MLTCRKRRYQQRRQRRVRKRRHRPRTNAMQTAQQSVWLRPRRPRTPTPRRWLVFRLKLTAHYKLNTNIVVSVVNDQYLSCHKNVNHLFSTYDVTVTASSGAYTEDVCEWFVFLVSFKFACCLLCSFVVVFLSCLICFKC